MCYIADHPNVMFDKLKITDMRNTYDIWRKYCCLQMVNVSIGSAPVGVEQLSDQHIQKMAPQKKKTASSKKKAAEKKSPPRKTAPKTKQTNLRDLEEDKEFTDVTLACRDGQQVEAHKVVLIATNPFFEKILRRNQHPHPLFYMRSLQPEWLIALEFFYGINII